MVIVALMGGNATISNHLLVSNILSSAMVNAMEALTSVETSALFPRIRQPRHTSTSARISASTTP